jgi:hypothetical protein
MRLLRLKTTAVEFALMNLQKKRFQLLDVATLCVLSVLPDKLKHEPNHVSGVRIAAKKLLKSLLGMK